MKVMEGIACSISGPMLLVNLPKRGFLGVGKQFGRDREEALSSAFRAARRTKKIETGWTAYYRYDPDTNILSVKATIEGEAPPSGWKGLEA